MLECLNVTKTFGKGRASHTPVREVSFCLKRKERCLLLGPSGSGKTTLLTILGGLLSPSFGSVRLSGIDVPFASKRRMCDFRRKNVGFVFQHAQLLPFLTIRQNLELIGRNAGMESRQLKRRIEGLSERVGIKSILDHRPDEASGGERQRAAVLRAILGRPMLILADEPTASLDSESGGQVADVLCAESEREDALLVTVTHDSRLAERFQRVFQIQSGRVLEQ